MPPFPFLLKRKDVVLFTSVSSLFNVFIVLSIHLLTRHPQNKITCFYKLYVYNNPGEYLPTIKHKYYNSYLGFNIFCSISLYITFLFQTFNGTMAR